MAFGRDLQHEREQRGISLEAMAEATKISSRHLEALEAGDHAQLPGGIFNKGIVRAYCRYLALDEEEWLARFSSFTRQDGEEDWAEFAQAVKRNRVRMDAGNRIRWWIVLLMLVALATAGWAVWRYAIKPRLHPPVGTVASRAAAVASPFMRKRTMYIA